MNFCRQFAVMLSAGIPVLAGLEILEKQTESAMLKQGIRTAAQSVEKGSSLKEALLQRKDLFSPFFTGMVDAGETGGILEQTMQRLACYFHNKYDLEQKIKSATAYPKLVFCIIFTVAVFLLVFVIPSFDSTFASMGVELPLPTRLLIAIGKGLHTYWPFIITGCAAGYLVLCRIMKTEKFIYLRDRLRLRLPLMGHLYHKMMIAQFCRNLSTMLGSGVELLTALELSKNVADNTLFASHIDEVKKSVIRGVAVGEALAATGFFPLLVIGMVKVGEQSGKLEEMLAHAADLYEAEVKYAVKRLGSLLEPALILFLSLMVGSIVLSIFLPLFSVFNSYL